MKTKEFIKMLQEADPSGEAYIRMEGGVPYYAEYKEGYWDGYYSYIDDGGNYTSSIKDSKVDIFCQDIDLFVEGLTDLETEWDEVKNKFRFEFSGYHDGGKDRIERIYKEAKESFDSMREILQNLYDSNLKEMIEAAESGWRWFQNMEVDNITDGFNNHVYYTWKIFDSEGNDKGSNIKQTESIQKSGLWEKIVSKERPNYYEWKFIN